MPSYRLRCVSQKSVTSTSQVDCDKTLTGDPVVDLNSHSLPPINVDPLAFLDFDNFKMLLPSESSNSMRNSLEYSEEESLSDESAYQPSSLPQWSATEVQSEFEAYYPEADSRRRSGSTTSSQAPPEQLHLFQDLNDNRSSVGSSQRPSSSMLGSKKNDYMYTSNVYEAIVPEAKTDEKNGGNKSSIYPPPSVMPNDTFNRYRETTSKTRECIPRCQSDTMHSVFEDDSDDEEVPYLKKVLTWIPKKSKLDKNQPTVKRQKSRIFKRLR